MTGERSLLSELSFYDVIITTNNKTYVDTTLVWCLIDEASIDNFLIQLKNIHRKMLP